jgi:hypothetical protein
VAPGGGTGTWFWVSAIAFLVFAVARYVIACRRSGRKINPLPILLVLAAFGVGAVLQGTNSPWQFLILALVPAFFAWAWFRRNGTKLELGPSASAVDIWVEELSPLSQVFPLRRGHARLFVDEGTIATRGLVTGGVTTSWLDFGGADLLVPRGRLRGRASAQGRQFLFLEPREAFDRPAWAR